MTHSSYSYNSSETIKDNRPHFLITIDTEGDNLWAKPQDITTMNAKYLPRFQELCERYGFKVCYLTDYDMALSPEFVQFASDALRSGNAEIGMHLHAWSTPPLTEPVHGWDKDQPRPYLIEFPDDILYSKIAFMTNLLNETFGIKVRSHRSGRWAFNHIYARALIEHDYWVDCSVTPHVSWKEQVGYRWGNGGSDYSHFPQQAYFLHPDDISRPGSSKLLEVPMTIMPSRFNSLRHHRHLWRKLFPIRWVLDHLSPPPRWLRPKKDNLLQMLSILSWAQAHRHQYVEFMLHSSEFMPGGSPSFQTAYDIDLLYDNLTALFETASQNFKGSTLTEYYHAYCATSQTASG